jgi:hypothetical protein
MGRTSWLKLTGAAEDTPDEMRKRLPVKKRELVRKENRIPNRPIDPPQGLVAHFSSFCMF